MSVENKFTGDFQKEIIYSDEVLRPKQVVKSSALALRLFFDKKIEDTSVAKYYLSNTTSDFLRLAEIGYLKRLPNVWNLEKIPHENLLTLLKAQVPVISEEGTKENDEEREAFEFSMVTFTFLHKARHAYLPDGFSKRGMLAPPVTSIETLERFGELKEEVAKIAGGEIKQNANMNNNPPLARTYLYFQIADTLPLHFAEPLEKSA